MFLLYTALILSTLYAAELPDKKYVYYLCSDLQQNFLVINKKEYPPLFVRCSVEIDSGCSGTIGALYHSSLYDQSDSKCIETQTAFVTQKYLEPYKGTKILNSIPGWESIFLNQLPVDKEFDSFDQSPLNIEHVLTVLATYNNDPALKPTKNHIQSKNQFYQDSLTGNCIDLQTSDYTNEKNVAIRKFKSMEPVYSLKQRIKDATNRFFNLFSGPEERYYTREFPSNLFACKIIHSTIPGLIAYYLKLQQNIVNGTIGHTIIGYLYNNKKCIFDASLLKDIGLIDTNAPLKTVDFQESYYSKIQKGTIKGFKKLLGLIIPSIVPNNFFAETYAKIQENIADPKNEIPIESIGKIITSIDKALDTSNNLASRYNQIFAIIEYLPQQSPFITTLTPEQFRAQYIMNPPLFTGI
jgi:hypothetical protein